MSISSTKNKNVSRFYNHLLFKENRVIKGTSEERYNKEVSWFKKAKKIIPNNIPHIYLDEKIINVKKRPGLKYYKMQNINGENLYQWMIANNDNKEDIYKTFNKVIKLVKKLHQEKHKSIKTNPNDIFQMYYLKPKSALTDFINKSKINTNQIIINGRKFSNPIEKLEKTYKRLEKKLLDTKYTFIHGDLTMSNTVISNQKKLYLIDPRGSFGSTKFYGDPRYDIAKLYYSIFGNYDSLNNGKFSYKKNSNINNNHSYSIESNNFNGYQKKLIKELKENNEIIQFIHATIWLSLIPHVANNIKQQWCTFCNSIYLLNTITKNEN